MDDDSRRIIVHIRAQGRRASYEAHAYLPLQKLGQMVRVLADELGLALVPKGMISGRTDA